jgi:signal peptidase I
MKHAHTPADAKAAKTRWTAEIASWFFLLVLVFCLHSAVAKPFYIASESMMPVLLKGDQLVVSKYPYGWSWVSPSFHILPPIKGRLLGRLPKRGDIVILTPPGQSSDYIKRVIGLPGDELEMIKGQLYIDGKPVKREALRHLIIPVDENAPCSPSDFPGARVLGPGGRLLCRLPIIRETLPNGRSYETIDLGYFPTDDFAKIKVPKDHVFLMGDHRDKSADSRVRLQEQGLGGSVPYENIGGRAEIITFSLDGTSQYLNPLSWFSAFRGGRAGSSLHPRQTAIPRQ